MNAEGKHSWVKHADFIALDLLALALAFAIACRIRFGDFDFLGDFSWLGFLALAFIVDVAFSVLSNIYSGVLRRTYYEDAMKLALFALACFAMMGLLLFVFKLSSVYSRAVLGIMYVVYFLLAVTIEGIHKHRILSKHAEGLDGGARSLLVVAGLDNVSDAVTMALTGDFKEYELMCVCCSEVSRKPPCAALWNAEVIYLDQLVGYCVRRNVDDVLVCVPPALLSEEVFRRLVANGVTVHFDLETLLGIQVDVQSLTDIGLLQTVSMGEFSFGPGQLVYLAVKRVFDIVIGLVGCVLLLPVALLVKLACLVTGDRAPMLYTQTRVGMRGREFKLAKFRTMVPNADEVLEQLLRDPARRAEWDRDQKLSDDPRITRVGRVLRKTSIDEFPQFWNILKGDMSLVGPRPLIPGELEQHRGLTLYNKVKPGITGWWACNGRSNIEYRERLEMEYYYVRNCSLLLDVTCIARTAIAVLRKEGAR